MFFAVYMWRSMLVKISVIWRRTFDARRHIFKQIMPFITVLCTIKRDRIELTLWSILALFAPAGNSRIAPTFVTFGSWEETEKSPTKLSVFRSSIFGCWGQEIWKRRYVCRLPIIVSAYFAENSVSFCAAGKITGVESSFVQSQASSSFRFVLCCRNFIVIIIVRIFWSCAYTKNADTLQLIHFYMYQFFLVFSMFCTVARDVTTVYFRQPQGVFWPYWYSGDFFPYAASGIHNGNHLCNLVGNTCKIESTYRAVVTAITKNVDLPETDVIV